MSNFVSLQTALSGLRAGQIGMDIAGHNIANANTPGFTRQRVELTASAPYGSPVGPLGSGVQVSDISRARDGFLDARSRTGLERSAWLGTAADLLARAEAVMAEPEHGISAELAELWAAFGDLALQPDDPAARHQVLAALESLAGSVRSVAHGWDQLAADTGARLHATVDAVDDLLGQVARLNLAIPDTLARQGTPNDLLDARDALLDELAAAIGAQARLEPDGTVTVLLDGVALVEGGEHRHVGLDADLRLLVRAGGDGPTLAQPRAGGEVGGLQTFLASTLPERHDRLDDFVERVVAALNEQHRAGSRADGEPGGDLLAFDPAAGAARTLTVALPGPEGLAAAAGPGGGAQDGRNAEALARLGATAADGSPGVDAAYRAQVTQLGRDVAAARSAWSAQHGVTSAALIARQNSHGVNLDEEMVTLVQFQRALEAASRVMTAVDQALDVLINRTGLVGR